MPESTPEQPKAAQEITQVTIEHELKQSYLDYAMSVIVGRALPDIRDGLKPVHRRVLFAMSELGNDYNKPYKKSARIVGDVIGKYHPHGDTAVYDTIVRMAQPFSMRIMLVDGQGNFGSVDGDSAAAMRYTEIRLAKYAHSLMADLDRETVDFGPNYDESEMMPLVMPTRVPNLLINGSSGIAVGMATNIPPHNPSEVINACIDLIDRPEMTLPEIMKHIPGPDFPTAGIINGRKGIIEAYKTGRGRIHIRARVDIETHEKSGKQSIVVTELPYQVNKARLLEKIGELVRDKKIQGISALRDESDRDGMRMVVEVRKGEVAEVVLNNLFAQTQLQVVFGINVVALDNGQPRQLSIKQLLEAFIQHRREIVTRRTIFDLRKARERAHLLEGLSVALANIDAVIALIKAAKTPADAKEGLLAQSWAPGSVAELLKSAHANVTRPQDLALQYGLLQTGYRLSSEQAQAILDLRLHRLTGLETSKIHEEYQGLINTIQALIKILSNPDELNRVIRDELTEAKQNFGDLRRTVITDESQDLSEEDLITEEDVAVTLSHEGYIKAQSLDSYSAQRRGGRGKAATTMKEADFVKNLLVASSHDTILCFSTLGKVYWLKTYEVPQAGRTARGKPIVNLLPLEKEEAISAILPVRTYSDKQFIFMATEHGYVKKVALTEFERQRTSGKIAVELNDGDRLIGVAITDGQRDIMLISSEGKSIRFNEEEARPMGRTARGVRGIKMGDGHRLISLIIVDEAKTILCATEYGYGQRTKLDDYRRIGRGGQGVRAIQVSERNGKVVSATQVSDSDEVLLITDGGTLVRIRASEISVIGRNTQGVRLINLTNSEKLVGMEPVAVVDAAADKADEIVVDVVENVVDDIAEDQEAEQDDTGL